MKPQELKDRTKALAVRVLKMAKTLESDYISRIVAKQMVRSGTSVAANYRAACFAKSPKDFINKLKIVEEELDETIFWMEILIEVIQASKLKLIINEAEELFKIITKSILTAKSKQKSTPIVNRQ